MYIIKYVFEMYIMNVFSKLFKLANVGMVFTLVFFVVLVVLSYGWEAQLPIALLAVMHVLQIFVAGFFKVFYVLRLVSLKEMGLPTH